MASIVKRVLVGRPLASAEEAHQRLPKTVALPVFASDAISSTAYATEEILLVLIPAAGLSVALSKLVPIAIVVVILLAIVVTSYRQTVFAYPSGGGSYIVSRENLGVMPSLVAGASLLVDYILTVAVSVSAGVAAILSAAQSDTLFRLRVPICLVCVLLMMLANLRGMKESGRLFAGPTYVYIVALGVLLIVGLYQTLSGNLHALPPNEARLEDLTHGTVTGLSLLILLRAFSSGAIALSGVEAISNGVPAFRKPESRNAARTLTIMGAILGTYFFGIAVLAHHLAPVPSENETLLSVMGRAVFGSGTPMYLILQISTFAILVLAANTAYADFPRLSSIIARDGFLPRQLSNRGDRLVFSNGILVLSGAAAVLIVAFGGQTSLLIQLYAVGVFTGFTLSQAGMVVHHWRLREPHWKIGLVINATGAFATALVALIVVVSKFTKGAWIPAVLIPLIVLFFKSIKSHYTRVEEALDISPDYRTPRHTHTIVVLVGRVHRATLAAIAYARSLAPDRLVAMSVVTGAEEAEEIQKQWSDHHLDIPLEIKLSPYRDLTGSVVEFIDELDQAYENDIVTVILPEFVLTRWWEQLLHNQSALMLKARLLFRRNTVVVSVPYHIEHGKAEVLGDPEPELSRPPPSSDGQTPP
ncbi:MAG TPA: APC family permease [Acidimicrobiales bacterium]|jgi:amino acid transporter|nr:APC family permease [Acidimicrobiales bacterium]